MTDVVVMDDDDVIEVSTDDLPGDGKPAPIVVEIAGRDYELSWSKDHFWMQYFAAFTANDGASLFRASMELLQVSLSAVQAIELEGRLRNLRDPLDTPDLMAAVTEMSNAWQDEIVPRMEAIGVAIPEKLKEKLNRADRRASEKKRVVKAPSKAKRK